MDKISLLARALVALVLLANLPPLSLGQSQNDAGTGGDAPEDWRDAVDVTSHSWDGTRAGEGDTHDWYRIPLSEDKSAEITLTPRGTAHFTELRVLTDDGRNLSYSRHLGWDMYQVVSVPPGHDAVRIDAIVSDEAGGDYTVAVRLVEPRPQAEGGYPDDAADTRHAARETMATTIHGEIRPIQGDREDWFRYVVPAGMMARVTLTPDDGAFWLDSWGDIWEPGDYELAEPGESVTVGVPSGYWGAARIGVIHHSGEGFYTLRVEFLPLASLRPSAIEVSPAMGPVPERTRTVDVTVSNAGRGPADQVRVTAWVTTYQPMATDRRLGMAELAVPAQGEETVRFEWDTLGRAGTAYVTVCIESVVDDTVTDNKAHARVADGSPIVSDITDYGIDPMWHLPGNPSYLYCDTYGA